MKIKFIKLYISFLLLTIPLTISAQGHYNGGSFNTNDYFIPSASGWVFSVYYSFSEMNYYNNAGDKTDLIEISQYPPLTVELGQKVKTHSIIPMIS